MKKLGKYFGFLIIPLIKLILYIPRSENIKYGKILISIFNRNEWSKKQKKSFNISMDLLKNTLPGKHISTVYSNINRIYVGPNIDSSMDYCLTPCKLLIIFYKEGYTDNHRYLVPFGTDPERVHRLKIHS